MDLTKIPNDIPDEIRLWGEEHAVNTCYLFVALLSYIEGEIVERAFAMRKYKKKGLLITEVRRRATGKNSPAVCKNLLRLSIFGYTPVFEKKDKHWDGYGYAYVVFGKDDFDVWYPIEAPVNFACICLNSDILRYIEEFKYCGYTSASGDVIEFLNRYREKPLLEYFGKLQICPHKSLVSKAEEDKSFRQFLYNNSQQIRRYGPQTIIYAYNHSISFDNAYGTLVKRRMVLKDVPSLRGTKVDLTRVAEYCTDKKISQHSYEDYIKAVITLKYDLNDTKNLFPKDFKAMHDLRISEYDSYMDKIDRQKRKELYRKFADAGHKAESYQYSDESFSMIAPKDISDLKAEGNVLKHCVGKMGYDKKMADGKVVIMFLRRIDIPEEPFVTVEYDLSHRRLLQAHGKSNSRPSSEVEAFISKWILFMDQIMKRREKQYADKM